jgi:hypothetical protein
VQVVPFTAVAREWRLDRCLSRKRRALVQLPQDSPRSLSRAGTDSPTRRSRAFRTANLDGSPGAFSVDEI